MPRILVIAVRFHDGRYHGVGDWPPSPARLFQALVAGAARGGVIADEDRAALKWLEALTPPVIAAPAHRAGQGFGVFVPNNDIDAVGGDPRRVSEIRTAKIIRPRLFDPGIPFLYLWRFEDGADQAGAVCRISERLYQLGRGVDMAFARSELLEEAEAEGRVTVYDGAIHRPAAAGAGELLSCPTTGSLASLEDRFAQQRERFSVEGKGRAQKQLFTQPPKPRFVQVAYECPPARLLFDLRASDENAGFSAWPLAAAVTLVEQLRDGAARKLGAAMNDHAATIDRIFVGRNATEADKDQRLRIVPLPSIGHHHTDSSIRRVLIEIPPDCPLAVGDIKWAFSGIEPHDAVTGELVGSLIPAEGRRMLRRYGIGGGRDRASYLWRTVTPMALPERMARRRIDPRGRAEEAKGAVERGAEEARAATAVLQALRHARVLAQIDSIRVQREPFEAKGARAEVFAPGSRFTKERLRHVEIRFATPVRGPLVIGDGRYLGLGLMAPAKDNRRDVMVFALPREACIPTAAAPDLLRAVRRALMALSRDNEGAVPRLFSGHEMNGEPARPGWHEHVFLGADDGDGDGRIDRIVVSAPWACDLVGRSPRRNDRTLLDRVVSSLKEVRAGRLGVLTFEPPCSLPADDPLITAARVWECRTPYHPTRYARRGDDLSAVVVRDAVMECERRGLPRPEVEVLETIAGPNGGGRARLRLRFAVAVPGPIMLGRDSHMGGGLFAAVHEPGHAG